MLLATTLAMPGSAQQYKPEYKLSAAVGPAYAWGRGAVIWAQLIKERTGGRINIRQFPGSAATAGDPLREFPALREGTVDMAVGSALNWADQVPVLNLFALPFFVPDSPALDRMLRGEPGIAAFKAIEAAGVVPLAWGDNGFRALSTAAQAIQKPEQLAGLRLRTAGTAVVDEALKALGAAPVKMTFLAAQAALLAGTLDGQETTLPGVIATKLSTLGQKQITDWKIAADPLVFAVSRAAWESWSPADRDIVRASAIEAAKQETEQARAAAAQAEASLQSRDSKAAGVTLIRPDTEQRNALLAATRPVNDKWTAIVGVELVKAAQTAIAAGAITAP